MSNFSYDDFAVLVRNFNQNMLNSDSLRIVPLFTAPSMAVAIKGELGADLSSEAYIPAGADGSPIKANVEVQHKSAGYCRLVGHIEPVKPQEGQEVPVTKAKAFVLYSTVEDASEGTDKKEVIAVASLKEEFEIGAGCYPSFTITTVNNYQSVAFNPNAFATVEDIKNINGLDGLHIAFDTASGDLKLLDKDGNVLDQANLPIKADVIIAEGEEGYKYVKTDVEQDIHAAKAWMPAGDTAWEDVLEAPYTMRHAALVVGPAGQGGSVRSFVPSNSEGESYPISVVTYTIGNYQNAHCTLTKYSGEIGPDTITEVPCEGEAAPFLQFKEKLFNITDNKVEFLVIKYNNKPYLVYEERDGSCSADELTDTNSFWNATVSGTIETRIGSSAGEILGIAVKGDMGDMMYTFDGASSEINNISDQPVDWFGSKAIPEGSTLKYGLEAFVWTVKGGDSVSIDTFFGKLNASLLALGFHEGDDIALGTNLKILAPAEGTSPLNRKDADEYMHGETNKELREQEVDAQRKLAKEELIAWNAQHPALTKNKVAGTRISSDGVDIRDGKILIGDGSELGNDGVKHYELSTNFKSAGQKDQGLALNVVTDASSGIRNVLTISEAGYISGAPICMDMHGVQDQGEEGLSFVHKRSTACFECNMVEDKVKGTVSITITDNRLNSKGFSGEDIVEISPVYISGGSAHEMLPALTTVNTVATFSSDNPTQLTCTCPQIIDWANSVNLLDSGNSMFVIVKVY